ncbi:hypothetical protein F9968_19085 [Bacteroides stercoris]|nr:hypothetical protein F9968_19085 [Bacteroides stercoris]
MSIQIGKLLPDGSVRHIKALHETLSKDLVRKLRVFYPNDRRVDALLSLGDIQKLRFWHKERPSSTCVLTLTARFST